MDFVEMLVSVLDQGMTPSTGRRIGNSPGQRGGLDIGGLLGSLGGGAMNDILGNLGQTAGAAIKSGPDGSTNPVVTGGLGTLAGALLGGGSGSARRALGGPSAISSRVHSARPCDTIGTEGVRRPNHDSGRGSTRRETVSGVQLPERPRSSRDSRTMTTIRHSDNVRDADGVPGRPPMS